MSITRIKAALSRVQGRRIKLHRARILSLFVALPLFILNSAAVCSPATPTQAAATSSGGTPPAWVTTTGILCAAAVALLTWILAAIKHRYDIRKLKLEIDNLATAKATETAPIFLEREQATPRMKEDMCVSESFVFVGISNGRLATFLSDVMETAKRNNSKLPLKSIHIVFARDDFGRSFKGPEFGHRMVASVLKIASNLTSPSLNDAAPDVHEIHFYQAETGVYCGGSMFRYAADREFAGDRYSVVYVTFYAPHPDPDTKHLYTTRTTARETTVPLQGLYDRHRETLDFVQHGARPFLELTGKNVWDISVQEWDQFETKHQVYGRIMRKLVLMGQVQPSHDVIDVACGTGRTSAQLAEVLTTGKLLLTDYSPQMLMAARKLFGENARVSVMLNCGTSPLYGAFEDHRFDRVFCNMSLGCLASDEYTAHQVAASWRNYAKPGGEVLISIGNTMLADEALQFKDWHDPLREELNAALRNSHADRLRGNVPTSLTLNHIKTGFAIQGFELIDEQTELFDRTFSDRIDMWRTPAVLNSVVDVTSMAVSDREHIIQSVAGRLVGIGDQTKPSRVTLLRFRLPA